MAEATAPQARLTYFAGWGLAEQTRWLLAATNVEWTQIELQENAQFESLRQEGKLLFMQLPLLEIDGLNLVQSQAMVRYVARRGGLQGQTAAEEAQVDMVCEGVKDARSNVVTFAFQDDQRGFVHQLPKQVNRLLTCFENLLLDGQVGVVASGVSTADVLLGELTHEFLAMRSDILDPFPKLRALHDSIIALPGIASYLASPKRHPLPTGRIQQAYRANVGTVLGWNR